MDVEEKDVEFCCGMCGALHLKWAVSMMYFPRCSRCGTFFSPHEISIPTKSPTHTDEQTEIAAPQKPKRRVLVRHSYYGCDRGCGHRVEVEGKEDVWFLFGFDHPNFSCEEERDFDAMKKWAIEFARKTLQDKLGATVNLDDFDWDRIDFSGCSDNC